MKNGILPGLPLGILLGFILSTIIYGLLDSTTGLVQQFFAEQFTHIITLIAAGIAFYGIYTQIQSNVNSAEKVRNAKLDAAKAVLPIVLSNISQLCTERYFAIACGRKRKSPEWRWEITDAELLTLKECIEYGTGIEKELMLQICRIYQVLIVRWEILEFEDLFVVKASNIDNSNSLSQIQQFNAIQNWVVLKSITSSLFNYSRGASSNPTDDEIIKSALSSMKGIYKGILSGKVGQSLITNANYAAYLEKKERSRKLEFVGIDWNF